MSETFDDIVCVHVNRRYVQSDVYDLDVYDATTLDFAVLSCAGHINFWVGQNRPDKARPYVAFKDRIEAHLRGDVQ